MKDFISVVASLEQRKLLSPQWEENTATLWAVHGCSKHWTSGRLDFYWLVVRSSNETSQCHANLEIPNFNDIQNNISWVYICLSCKLSRQKQLFSTNCRSSIYLETDWWLAYHQALVDPQSWVWVLSWRTHTSVILMEHQNIRHNLLALKHHPGHTQCR